MDLLLQRLLDGVGNGVIYAIIALAIVLVYVSTGTINLALPGIGVLGTFVVWWLWNPDHLGIPLPVAVLAGVLAGFLIGAVLQRAVIQPLANESDHLPIVVVTLGVLLAFESLAGFVFTVDTVTLPSLFPAGGVQLGAVTIRFELIGLVLTVAVIGLLLFLLFRHTRVGLAMRASVDNPNSARLVGVRRSLMLMAGWALSGALVVLAGVLVAPTVLVSTNMLNNPLFLGLAAAALGGLTSFVGAAVGGLLIGLIEVLVPAYVPFVDRQLSLLAVFVVMIAMLVFRPNGLFGRAEAVRV